MGFTCMRCGAGVLPSADGSCRNHCPFCLWSKHVDDRPGDRASACGGPMEPVGLDHRPAKGHVIVHRCTRCGRVKRNRAAAGAVQPDELGALVALGQFGPH